jgi:hypothetical protein
MRTKCPGHNKLRSGIELQLQAVGITLVWFLLSCSSAPAAGVAEFYPGRLGIAKARYLSPEEQAVEARFAAYLEAHTEKAIQRYREKFGKEISTDNVRELSSDYAPGGIEAGDPASVAARTNWSNAVFQPARALAKELYARALRQKTPPGGSKSVLFTAGGAGVGKTTLLRQSGDLIRKVERADFVYDTTLSTFPSATERIARALDSGRTVQIIFVYRDPVDAFVAGLLPRAKKTGRIMPLDAFLATHLGAVREIQKIAYAHKYDSRLTINTIDNRGGPDKPVEKDFAFIEAMARKYSPEPLHKSLMEALNHAYERGKKGDPDGISKPVYLGIKGRSQGG